MCVCGQVPDAVHSFVYIVLPSLMAVLCVCVGVVECVVSAHI